MTKPSFRKDHFDKLNDQTLISTGKCFISTSSFRQAHFDKLNDQTRAVAELVEAIPSLSKPS
jgi:hypothetical protein